MHLSPTHMSMTAGLTKMIWQTSPRSDLVIWLNGKYDCVSSVAEYWRQFRNCHGLYYPQVESETCGKPSVEEPFQVCPSPPNPPNSQLNPDAFRLWELPILATYNTLIARVPDVDGMPALLADESDDENDTDDHAIEQNLSRSLEWRNRKLLSVFDLSIIWLCILDWFSEFPTLIQLICLINRLYNCLICLYMIVWYTWWIAQMIWCNSNALLNRFIGWIDWIFLTHHERIWTSLPEFTIGHSNKHMYVCMNV